MQKRLLDLGTFKSQMSPVKCVKVEGNHVVTCGYLTDNSENKLIWIKECAHYKWWITSEKLKALAQPQKKTEYGQYMIEMAGGE